MPCSTVYRFKNKTFGIKQNLRHIFDLMVASNILVSESHFKKLEGRITRKKVFEATGREQQRLRLTFISKKAFLYQML